MFLNIEGDKKCEVYCAKTVDFTGMEIEVLNNSNLFDTPLSNGKGYILEHMKIMLYKENPTLFELLDFDNDQIFNEPLLFAYFYYKGNKKVTLEQILYGHIEQSKRPDSFNAYVDGNGLIYVPEIGWLKTNLANCDVILAKQDANEFFILLAGNKISFEFEPISKIDNTPFELINHPHPLLTPHFFDANNKLVDVEIEQITQIQKTNLCKAFQLIKGHVPEFYRLLLQSVLKLVIFNDKSVRRNSFATVSVHGCAFFNAFQPEYDEVFFVEDIAHQCGHVIFNNIVHNNKEVFRVSSETVVKETGLGGFIINLLEKRTLFVAFHALYTYYSIATCLEACLLKSDLTPRQKHEVLGRFAFCFRKYENDIQLLGKVDKNGNSLYFSDLGIQLYRPMEETYKRIKKQWQEKFKKLNLLNQPYNFSNKIFFKSNPIA